LRAEGLSEKSAVIVYADGCSMEPQIPDASVLLVNTASKNILRDKTYAFRSGDMLLVKKLRREKDGRIRAISNNPDKLKYPDLFYGLEDHSDFEMIGRVFWMGTRI
jgi:phage repressor protein C with HTH and peptisase S24 domain